MSAVAAAVARPAIPSRPLESLTRSHGLRLFLLAGVATLATLLPVALAATNALRSVGVATAASTPQNLALVAALGLVAPLASLRLSVLRILLVGGPLALALTLLTAGSVDVGAMLSLAYPALALALSLFGTIAAHHVMLEVEHEQQRLQCARFVPEQVVEAVLRPGSRVELGGIEVSGTIVFVDLRGFTTFSESRPAADVIGVLNRYLSEIQCAMLAHGGTTVSYLGDGLMAVFGAPLELPDHADRALAAAREIVEERLPAANEWMREQGLGAGFRIGIGINSGSFVAGNVGSDRRLEYTAIGDTANTASRIQDLTKTAGVMLLVDRSTCDCLGSPTPGLECVGDFDVRGRSGKVELWSLGCAVDCPLPARAA